MDIRLWKVNGNRREVMKNERDFKSPSLAKGATLGIYGEYKDGDCRVSPHKKLELLLNRNKMRRPRSVNAQKRAKLKLKAKKVSEVFTEYFPDFELTDDFLVSVKRFIQMLGVDSVIDAMDIACQKLELDIDEVIKYFCGICWFRIKEKQGDE